MADVFLSIWELCTRLASDLCRDSHSSYTHLQCVIGSTCSTFASASKWCSSTCGSILPACLFQLVLFYVAIVRNYIRAVNITLDIYIYKILYIHTRTYIYIYSYTYNYAILQHSYRIVVVSVVILFESGVFGALPGRSSSDTSRLTSTLGPKATLGESLEIFREASWGF